MTRVRVNNFPRDEDLISVSGESFSDPYQWLEQDSEGVRQWQKSQANLASAYVRDWPSFGNLRGLVDRFSTVRPERGAGLPRYAAGRWFRQEPAKVGGYAQVVVSEEPFGDSRVIYNLLAEDNSPVFLSWLAPSPDGTVLAVGICTDGSEGNTILLVDVATGRRLPNPPEHRLMDNWTGGVQWLADSSGFFFSAVTGASTDFDQSVYLHLRVPRPHTQLVEIPWTQSLTYRMVSVSGGGKYAVALEGLTQVRPVAVAVIDAAAPFNWRKFVTSVIGNIAGHVVGDRYIAITDVGAPRGGRLVALALDAQDPNNVDCWQELVPETEFVMRSVNLVGDMLYLSGFDETYSRIRIVDLNGYGQCEVPLPTRGALSEAPFPISALASKNHPDQFLFGFSTLIESPGIYRHSPGQDSVETLRVPQTYIENASVEDCWAISADGTRIPYHMVRPAHVKPGYPHPTLIYAYGGFNVPLVPQFPGPMAAFVAAGGVFVHAHLRGGGEFGVSWWENGRLRNKQNGYEDLYAVAEDLIAKKHCIPKMLALTGGSNGGLMAGVALTQRPDLWRVVVPRVPILDLVGTCREAYGRMCALLEYGDVSDPEEIRRIARFSPYHLVKKGVHYPAVFIDAGDTDPRCPPWHARKFAARLQDATASEELVFVHIWENVGHGWATAKNIAVTEYTEWLAFTMRHLGLASLPSNA